MSGLVSGFVLQDGISAEIMSLANGQHEVAELLSKLRPVCRVFSFSLYMFIYCYSFHCRYIKRIKGDETNSELWSLSACCTTTSFNFCYTGYFPQL